MDNLKQLILSGRLFLQLSIKTGFILTYVDGMLECEKYYEEFGFDNMDDFISYYLQVGGTII